jgi:transcription initiation factor TFIIF subunit beta
MAKKARKDLTVTDVGPPRIMLSDRGDNFLRLAETKKTRPSDNKYTRIESDLLLNILAEKFRTYRFYSLRRLKEETRQPEAHLREVLSKIAYLVKRGTAANHWTLRPEMAEALNLNPEDFKAQDEDAAKEDEIARADDEDEDEEMEEMETVV